MERQNRMLTILATVLLVLVAIVVLGKQPDDAAVDPDAPPERKLFTLEADAAQALTLVNASGTITFAKEDGAWKMTAPKALAVEERRVEEIVDRLASLKVSEKPFEGPLADYGLDEANRVTVTVGTGDGKTLTLYVGRDTPVGYKSYVAEKPEGPALLSSSRVGDLVKRTPDDFRSKEPWEVSAASAHRIRIEDAGAAVVLRKDDHGWWIGDDGPRAKGEDVESWLTRASMLRAESFLDDADPASTGLATPSGSITVDDDAGTHTLRFGLRDEAGVAAASDVGAVRLPADAAGLLQLDGWTDDALLPVRRGQVDTMEVTLGDKSVRLTKTDGAWKDAEGKDFGGADVLLQALADAKADRTAADVTLGATWGTITLAEGETRKETVTLGQELPAGGRAAKDAAGGPPFRVPAETITAISAAVP